MTDYSQDGQQEVFARRLAGRRGRLLDVGAHDGTTGSNSRALIEAGWGGVLIEPCPAFAGLASRLWAGRADVAVICAAVADGNPCRWHEPIGDGLGTRHREFVGVCNGHGYRYKETWCPTVSPAWVASIGPFDAVLIDCDEDNLSVFAGLVDAGLRPFLWCVEFSRFGNESHREEIERIMRRVLGLAGIETCGGDMIGTTP